MSDAAPPPSIGARILALLKSDGGDWSAAEVQDALNRQEDFQDEPVSANRVLNALRRHEAQKRVRAIPLEKRGVDGETVRFAAVVDPDAEAFCALQVSFTGTAAARLGDLLRTGLWGATPNDVVERIVCAALSRMA